MTCGEVATAKRLGITLPVVVLDDRWLALIKVKQIRRQYSLYGTELQPEDYREPPAHYFGVPALAANSADALECAVKKALAAAGPTVIEASSTPTTMWTRFTTERENTLGRIELAHAQSRIPR